MTLTLEQQQAAYTNTSVAVTAGAGTGKTHMLSERYLFHITRQQLTPLQIVAVTYTEKAAAELRARIRKNLRAHLADRKDMLAELEAAQISTFHGLCARICREHPDAARIPADFRILDELEGPIWYAEQLQLALEALPAHFYSQIPYSRMCGHIKTLLKDPIAARKALDHGEDSWQALVSRERSIALAGLLSRPEWRQVRYTLESYAGQPDDRREDNRRLALQAMVAIDAGEDPAPWLEQINSLNFSGGRSQKWLNGGFDEVKHALTTLRDDLVRPALKEGLVTLALGAVDTELARLLPVLKESFYTVENILTQAKFQNRVLDYPDLEIYALQALENPDVREYYARRWKAYLIDEFQDTNPVQSELLEKLAGQAIMTVVGDEKQSIYGFRRADMNCFQAFRKRIVDDGGEEVSISLSFRTHEQLVTRLNTVFQSVLGDYFQNLGAHRQEPPHEGPHLRAFMIEKAKGTSRTERRRAEAQWIASVIGEMLNRGIQVYDKQTARHRPLRPGDIGILSRTWAPLTLYGEVLQAAGIPAVHAGGGNLLDTREAKDGLALVRFLADPGDNLAIAAILRSPFFAVSDRVLFRFAQEKSSDDTWWQALEKSAQPELHYPRQVLGALLKRRYWDMPSRLLKWADRMTGYSAVIANLSNGSRRDADWQGFYELVARLESDSGDIFSVARRLKYLREGEVEIPRPMLEPENAVALMTIHKSKGLEWPIVIVPDLTRQKSSPDRSYLRYDAELGVGIKLEDMENSDELQKPAIYRIIEVHHNRSQQDELKRLLYVALTRARDHVILTACEDKGGAWELIEEGLQAAQVPVQVVTLQEVADKSAAIRLTPTVPGTVKLLEGQVASGLTQLPVTALTDYALCPKRFYFHYVEGHPGIYGLEGHSLYGERIGSLVHKALEMDIHDPASLSRLDPDLPQWALQEALQLVDVFHTSPVFESFRQEACLCEHPLQLEVEQNGYRLLLNGIIDRLGDSFVLDYKTDREMHPERHRMQLWAYATATGRTQAHVAYLRHDRVYTYTPDELKAAGEQVRSILGKIVEGRFAATPQPQCCSVCPYQRICDDYHADESQAEEEAASSGEV